MATRKAKEIITKIAEPVVVKGSHLTVTIYPDGKRKLEWDDEALARDVVGGEKAEKFYKLFSPDVSIIKEIKGQIACRGIVIGKVKILLSPKEIYKIEKGDILVATMTTPDYIPAMSKAAAIVTSEGGLTCHAAIVSRELKIPCIIGTKIAHIILKDGDLVEVDANNGVVRIIK